jgi:NitT/TauT family transport system permease protein
MRPAGPAPAVVASAAEARAPARPASRRSWLSGGSGVVRKLRILLLLLLVWEALVRLFDVNPLLFPPASTVALAWMRGVASGELIRYAAQSLQILLTGMLIGVGLAILLVTLATTTRFGRDLLETITSMFNPLPAIALMPLALIWFGLGTGSLVFVIVHAVLWPMSLNAYTGFVTVPQTLVRVGENFGLRGWSLVSGILLPAAFPYLLTGVKIGWAFAWRTIIAAEMVFGVTGSRGGLGWFIYTKRYELDTPDVFAGLVTIIIIGLAVENLVFRFVERRTVVRWGMQTA